MKEILKTGQPAFGSWVMIGNLAVAEILAGVGFDWIAVDMEHTAIDYRSLQELLCGIERRGSEGFVRVEDNNPVVIKRVLDCGARGIIVPQVKTREEAERAVAAALYPPQGVRGVALGRASEYGAAFDEYFESSNERIVIMAQIEHVEAVENIAAIAAVEGLDGVFLGPYDLSCSMGLPAQFDHPRMAAARATVKAAVQKAGKVLGIHETRPDARAIGGLLEEGFRFIACGIDTLFLRVGAGTLLEEVQRFGGH
ncbi:MAG: 4-hydroxy-3-methylbut-2-en-1-yl diphosphate synthase [Spirochaetales bacterium]|nr:4-hydroxy-3-methylbut-2-en-1-yl diphosphate synthase [Spirochaetales bacterium]